MLQFVREIPIRIHCQAPSERRGFLFHLSVGFSKDIDPDTGMSVNLVEVDAWLKDLQNVFQDKVLELRNEEHLAARLTYDCRDFLRRYTVPAGVLITFVRLSEERSGVFIWDQNVREGFFSQECSYFLEFFEEGKFVDLLQMHFKWLSPLSCQEDLFSEGLKLLKDVRAVSQTDLAETLTPFKGFLHEKGSILESISLEYRSLGYRLEL